MTTIKDIFLDYGPEYIQRFANRMPADHRKVIEAIVNCRLGHYGACIYQCTQCEKKHMIYRCCGNRHCLRLRRTSTIKPDSGCKISWIVNYQDIIS